jgi:hypothetical protein
MAKKQYDMESGADEQNYVEELEEKYPGELVVAAVRGALKRRRGKRSKYKMLSEYGSADDQGDMPYVIPVMPNEAFTVKQALDPIFDYYRAETFVDIDGIVIKSGASFDMTRLTPHEITKGDAGSDARRYVSCSYCERVDPLEVGHWTVGALTAFEEYAACYHGHCGRCPRCKSTCPCRCPSGILDVNLHIRPETILEEKVEEGTLALRIDW